MPFFCGCRPSLCPEKRRRSRTDRPMCFPKGTHKKGLDLSPLQLPAFSLIRQKEIAGAAPVSAASVSLTLSLYHTFLTPRKFSPIGSLCSRDFSGCFRPDISCCFSHHSSAQPFYSLIYRLRSSFPSSDKKQ